MKSAARSILFAWLVPIFLIATVPAIGAGSTYSSNANRAVGWLSSHQNGDGSWGATDDVKLLYTVEAVMALRAVSQRTSAYFGGIAWLENHCAPNVDFEARRMLALAAHGDNVQADQSYVQTAQMLTLPGNSGWGLTGDYQGSSLDSAVALLAWGQLGVTTNVQPALNYIKGVQLTGTDSGWAVAQETASDPVTTAFVLQALTGYKSMDSTLSTSIAYGVSALSAKVGSSSPTHVQALAALAYVRSGYTSNATTLLNTLSTAQSSDGSWSQDVYATAVCARAMAAAAGTDASSLSTTVYLVDPNLRTAVNKVLGKDSMDTLTRGDMAGLTSLSAESMGIYDLTGLEWATNLTYLDLQNNNITSIAPLSGLTGLTTELLAGNPVYSGGGTPVPAMSMPVLLLTAFLLMGAGVLSVSRKRERSKITRCLLLGLLSLSLAQATHAFDSKEASKGKLSAEKVQKIQAVGQAVLATKRAEPPSEAMEQLRQGVADIRQAVMGVHGGIVRAGNDTEVTATGGQTGTTDEQERHVRAGLEELSRLRGAVELDIEESTTERDHTVERNLVVKVRELEGEVEQALQSPVENRAEKYQILQDHLEIKRLSPAMPAKETPTMTTIVRHREN